MQPLIERVFPFHVTIARSMEIVGVGPRLRSILNADPIGCKLGDVVATDHPSQGLEFDTLSIPSNASQVLQVLESPELRLCGEFVPDTVGSEPVLRFIGTPWITDLGQLKILGLALRDFPSHGGLGDLLILLQTRNNSIEEMRKLAAKLRATSEELAARNQVLEEELAIRQRLEAQLQQAQKMEAVGRLAGGVAHDFNNVLMAITAYTSLALSQSDSVGLREHLELALEAADRATEITSRLLSFSRYRQLEETSVQLEVAIEDAVSLLRPLMSEQLHLAVSCKPDVGAILVDPTGLQQVIMNLVLNARDAIADGGTIELSAERQESSEAELLFSGERLPGEWGVISVRDNGAGIDADTLKRIFEPFFTTKQLGQGTGLGLATVWWILERSSGLVDVQTEPGVGTTISVHFPAVDVVAAAAEQEEGTSLPSWRILVVEDDPMVRAPLLGLLAEQGCDVEGAESGAEALDFLRTDEKELDCLLCDIILPDANGRDIAMAFKKKHPGLRAVLMSGYDPSALNAHEDGLALLSKPFTMDDLRIAFEGAG